MADDWDTLKNEAETFMDDTGFKLAHANRAISLEDFNKYFKAWFRLEIKEYDDICKVRDAYLEFAGSTTAGVDVMDGDVKVAVIPPLFDTTAIDLEHSGVAKLYAMRDLEARNLPRIADNNFKTNLGEYVEDTIKKPQGTNPWETFREWVTADEVEVVDKGREFNRRDMFRGS